MAGSGYASYWGYDAQENVVCLVTDFHVFDADDDEDEDDE